MLGTCGQGDKEAKSDAVSQQIQAPANSKAQKTVDHLLYSKENILNSEILWCLRMISSHESFNSCGDLSEIFQKCFLIVKLLQSSHWVKQRVDTIFYIP